MAKAGFWLQGAKGKLANAVFFKGQNGTVQRINVTPHNPRTQAQLYNRIIFQTVTAAKNALLPLINISFEGMDKRQAQQYFTKMNYNLLRNILKQKVEGNLGNTEEPYASFLPKGINVLTANDYVVSKGTLNTPGNWFIGSGSSLAVECHGVSIGSSETNVSILKKIFGMEPNSQITFALIGRGNVVYTVSEEEYLQEGDLEVIRFVPSTDVENVTIDVTDSAALKQSLANALPILFDYSKTSSDAIRMLNSLAESATLSSNSGVYNINMSIPALSTEQHAAMLAVGIIYSELENDEWHYSNCRLQINSEEDFALLSHQAALASWAPNGIPTDDGNFLEQGGSDNEL